MEVICVLNSIQQWSRLTPRFFNFDGYFLYPIKTKTPKYFQVQVKHYSEVRMFWVQYVGKLKYLRSDSFMSKSIVSSEFTFARIKRCWEKKAIMTWTRPRKKGFGFLLWEFCLSMPPFLFWRKQHCCTDFVSLRLCKRWFAKSTRQQNLALPSIQ